ncbi:hypothetical protein MNBD_ACTINO01-2471, partial [hydrothermal vent metagenome]
EAIELGRASGGIAVIAHPKTIHLRSEDFTRMFDDLQAAGLAGIEAHHPLHDLTLRQHLEQLASRLSLIATGGSDYHGMTKREFRVGTGTGDLVVPSEAFDAITGAIR